MLPFNTKFILFHARFLGRLAKGSTLPMCQSWSSWVMTININFLTLLIIFVILLHNYIENSSTWNNSVKKKRITIRWNNLAISNLKIATIDDKYRQVIGVIKIFFLLTTFLKVQKKITIKIMSKWWSTFEYQTSTCKLQCLSESHFVVWTLMS